MTIKESKVQKGKLTLGAGAALKDYSCQQTSIKIVPAFNEDGDAIEVLCGDGLSPQATTAWTMQFTAIQDFDDAAGLIMWAYDNDGLTVPFSWRPNTKADTWTGNLTVRALELGGEVAKRLTSDAEWPINGKPTHSPTPPVGIDSLTPATGPAAGGTDVTIKGYGFKTTDVLVSNQQRG